MPLELGTDATEPQLSEVLPFRACNHWEVERYRLQRSPAGSAPAEWGEWAKWMVVDEVEGVPVGFVWEHHDLIAHNTWGPVSYIASHNPLDADGVGNPVWREDGFDSPQAALRALVAQIEGSQGDS